MYHDGTLVGKLNDCRGLNSVAGAGVRGCLGGAVDRAAAAALRANRRIPPPMRDGQF